MIVVDASVLAKCYLNEPGSCEALALLEQNPKVFAPALVREEVAAAICRRVRLGDIEADDGKAKCRKWFELLATDTVELTPNSELLDGAIHLAVTLKNPLQDCLYLEVMRRCNGSLITADETFHKRVSPVYPGVQLLVTGKPKRGAAA
jgi:predicted nucleic acid-binding protein